MEHARPAPAVVILRRQAAGVAANFQRMVRIADATGIPVDDLTSELGSDHQGRAWAFTAFRRRRQFPPKDLETGQRDCDALPLLEVYEPQIGHWIVLGA